MAKVCAFPTLQGLRAPPGLAASFVWRGRYSGYRAVALRCLRRVPGDSQSPGAFCSRVPVLFLGPHHRVAALAQQACGPH
eukprot:4614642-Lingulodinium_polyedra.AAC.1